MSRRGTTAPDGSPVTTLHFAEILAATRENPLDVSGPVDLSIPAQGPARRRRQKEATR